MARKSDRLLGEFIFAVYGNPPPPKRADTDQAISLACDQLLLGVVDREAVRKHTLALAATPIPYSTHDLAVSVALNFFKEPQYIPHLFIAQLAARMQAIQWTKDGLVVGPLMKGFEDTLYKLYKTPPPARSASTPVPKPIPATNNDPNEKDNRRDAQALVFSKAIQPLLMDAASIQEFFKAFNVKTEEEVVRATFSRVSFMVWFGCFRFAENEETQDAVMQAFLDLTWNPKLAGKLIPQNSLSLSLSDRLKVFERLRQEGVTELNADIEYSKSVSLLFSARVELYCETMRDLTAKGMGLDDVLNMIGATIGTQIKGGTLIESAGLGWACLNKLEFLLQRALSNVN